MLKCGCVDEQETYHEQENNIKKELIKRLAILMWKFLFIFFMCCVGELPAVYVGCLLLLCTFLKSHKIFFLMLFALDNNNQILLHLYNSILFYFPRQILLYTCSIILLYYSGRLYCTFLMLCFIIPCWLCCTIILLLLF